MQAKQLVEFKLINFLTNWDQRGPTARERLLARKAEGAHRGNGITQFDFVLFLIRLRGDRAVGSRTELNWTRQTMLDKYTEEESLPQVTGNGDRSSGARGASWTCTLACTHGALYSTVKKRHRHGEGR